MEKKYQLKRKDLNIGKYNYLHAWLRKHFGKPEQCERCKLIGSKGKRRWNIEYALKPNTQYSKKREDYFTLCVSCHEKQDKGCSKTCSICVDKYFASGYCKIHYRKQYRQDNKEWMREYTRQWRIKNGRKKGDIYV